MKNPLDNFKNMNVPIEFNNPFLKEKINSIKIEIRPKGLFFQKEYTMEAVVYMQNGNTSADQKFKSNDLQDLLNQVTAFFQEFLD